jgi:hypothetical protein
MAAVNKRNAGRTGPGDTPLQVSAGDAVLGAGLQTWIYQTMGRKLGKYAPQIERSFVRFGDENGPKGGADKTCRIELVMSALPDVVVVDRGVSEREAFDRAVARAARAARHDLERHGFSAKQSARRGRAQAPTVAPGVEAALLGQAGGGIAEAEPDSLIGRRAGHGAQNLLDAAARPEKARRDAPVDTARAGTSASDRRAGYGHTARRNAKLNTAGMSQALEDSRTRPSRKSSRGGENRVKPDAPLSRRTKAAVHSPKARAQRPSGA